MVHFISCLVSLAALVGVTCASNSGLTQMVTYVKRHPNYTREDFWSYWQTQHAPKVVPLATYFNITRYQLVKLGALLPLASPYVDLGACTDAKAAGRYR
jgi:hypothetical protein